MRAKEKKIVTERFSTKPKGKYENTRKFGSERTENGAGANNSRHSSMKKTELKNQTTAEAL